MKFKHLQKEVNNLKTDKNIFNHLHYIPEIIDTQKIKTHFSTVSEKQSREALNRLKIWVEKVKNSKKEEIIWENKLKKTAKKDLELEGKDKC